jgi:exodeoxyribonuclease VII large subunit
MNGDVTLSVSEFVALFNQTMEFSFGNVSITGELANFRVSKNRWVYFDLKDDNSTLKFFGNVYQLPGPLEEGMMLKVRGMPWLHNLYGFSVNVMSIQPAGEGSIKKAADLLKAKLEKEGLFDPERKRLLPYPPENIGLITSRQSAAYADFIKVLGARWSGASVSVIDVQVQGEVSPMQIAAAVEQFNGLANPPEVLVLIRGGGSAEDLASFSTEQVTRSVAASRVPTLVAIGHEVDISLAELAADMRASTPSNAAELLVPDKTTALRELDSAREHLLRIMAHHNDVIRASLLHNKTYLDNVLSGVMQREIQGLENRKNLLEAFNPENILKRGYSIVRDKSGRILRDEKNISENDIVKVKLARGGFEASVRAKSK